MEQHPGNTIEAGLPDEVLKSRIYVFRGQKVMLDRDLAELYGVTTGNLNKAVKRNIKRFPEDFMFQLDSEEFSNLIFQNGISSWGGNRTAPSVFTEQGLAMLSGVLNSDRAIMVNIQIMRIFTKMRQFLNDTTQIHLELAEVKLAVEKLAKKQDGHDKNIDLIFTFIDRLEDKLEKPTVPVPRKVGFKVGKEK